MTTLFDPSLPIHVFPLAGSMDIGIVGVQTNGQADWLPNGGGAIATAASSYSPQSDSEILSLRCDHSILKIDHEVLKAEHGTLKADHEALKAAHEALLVEFERVRDLVLPPTEIGTWVPGGNAEWTCMCTAEHKQDVPLCVVCGNYRPSRPR